MKNKPIFILSNSIFFFVKVLGCKKNKNKQTEKFPVSEQEVTMPTTRETHHSGKILPFVSFYFFYTPTKIVITLDT
jgi:hypothetical protein